MSVDLFYILENVASDMAFTITPFSMLTFSAWPNTLVWDLTMLALCIAAYLRTDCSDLRPQSRWTSFGIRRCASKYVSSAFSAHCLASANPEVDNIVSIIYATSALLIKQPLSILISENGNSDLPLYSRDAGFIVTKTALNGDTFEIGIWISANCSMSVSNFLLSVSTDLRAIAF